MLGKLWNRCFPKKKHSSFEGLNVRPGDLAIDCGANVGLITEELRTKGAIVHAFEPNPHAFAVLQGKFGLDSKVHLYNQAVWVKDGSLKLYLHQNHHSDPVQWSTGSSIRVEKSNIDPEVFVDVETIRLSTFINDLKSKVKVLKIDVEGAEIEILNDLIDTGAYLNVEKIFVETHEMKMAELVQPLDELKSKIKKLKISNIDLNWV